MSPKKLTFCAMSIALATIASMIRLYRFPFGGSVTLFCMLFVMLPGWFYGVKEGVLCGLLYGILQFVLSPCFLTIPQFLLDYILAFSVMGIAGLWKSRNNGLIIGYLAAVAARWFIATLSGLVWVNLGYSAWENWSPLPYSMVYNAAYIFTEAAITVVILLIPAVRKNLEKIKGMANADI